MGVKEVDRERGRRVLSEGNGMHDVSEKMNGRTEEQKQTGRGRKGKRGDVWYSENEKEGE